MNGEAPKLRYLFGLLMAKRVMDLELIQKRLRGALPLKRRFSMRKTVNCRYKLLRTGR